jgi:hypothetical protein
MPIPPVDPHPVLDAHDALWEAFHGSKKDPVKVPREMFVTVLEAFEFQSIVDQGAGPDKLLAEQPTKRSKHVMLNRVPFFNFLTKSGKETLEKLDMQFRKVKKDVHRRTGAEDAVVASD